jgi:hypothetical protein
MEPIEITEFSNEMKEAGESSMTHVSLIISILAVLVAMVTVLGHREHTEAILLQARASDTWNEYQARKIRVDVTGKFSEMLALQPSRDEAAVQDRLRRYKSQTDKWQTELDADQEKAHDLEAEVAVAEVKAARFDIGEALLQISVVLASITLLTRRGLYVAAGAVLGLGGLLTAASTLLVH